MTENNIRGTISLTIAQTLKQERRRQYEKRLVSTIIISAMVLAMTGCGKTTEAPADQGAAAQAGSEEAGQEKTYKIALLEKGAEDFFLSIDKGFMDACKEYGVEGTVVAPSTYHDSAQINNAMSEIISTGYDAVVMCPQDYDANASAIDEAYNAGLPVICLDSLTASENYITSICTDNKAAGAEAADKMAELLGEMVERLQFLPMIHRLYLM